MPATHGREADAPDGRWSPAGHVNDAPRAESNSPKRERLAKGEDGSALSQCDCPDGPPGRISALTKRRSRAAAFTGSRNLLVRGAMDTTHRPACLYTVMNKVSARSSRPPHGRDVVDAFAVISGIEAAATTTLTGCAPQQSPRSPGTRLAGPSSTRRVWGLG
jgi:hypothetical protein